MEGQVATQKDVKEKEIPKVKVQPLEKMQPNRMEINMATLGPINMKRRTTILDKTTLVDRGIRISNPDKFMWILTK